MSAIELTNDHPRSEGGAHSIRRLRLQRRRAFAQGTFMLLFILAPVFDLFRYDPVAGHAWLLGHPWRLDLEDFAAGRIDAVAAAANVLLRLLLPIMAAAIAFLLVAWRWGRLYCGWLCPHFSVVETINRLLRRATGKHSVWDRTSGPLLRDGKGHTWLRAPDGRRERIDRRWWFVVVPVAAGFAFLWAIVLLTYLLPPGEIYGNLVHGTFTRNQTIFLTAATLLLSLEFLFARHLFCRYACAVGMFQSLAWIANPRAMVIGFERVRVRDCVACPVRLGGSHAACEDACPMRLNPRNIKRRMFACTQCAQCVSACGAIQKENPRGTLLQWIEGEAAEANEAGFRPNPAQRPPKHA